MSLKMILDSYDARSDVFMEVAVYEEIRKADKAGELAEDDQEQVKAEMMAFGFSEGAAEQDTGWGTYYGPMLVMKNDAGQWTESPSIQLVDQAIIDHWAQRAQESRHPLLKIRYADLCWDLFHRAIGNKPDPKHARLVIDAALGLIHLDIGDLQRISVQKKLARALLLALSLNDAARTKQVRDAIIACERKHGEDSKVGTWGYSFDLLVQNKKVPVPEGAEDQIIQDLEGRLARISTPDTEDFDPHGTEAAARRLATHYRRKGRPEDVARVLGNYSRAFQHMASSAPLPGSTWLRGVHDTLVECQRTRYLPA